jgi:spore germination protein KB
MARRYAVAPTGEVPTYVGPMETGLLVASGLFGPGMFTFPQDATAYAQGGVAYAYLLQAGATLLAAGAYLRLARRFPGHGLPQILNRLLGPLVGNGTLVAVALFDLATAAAALAGLAEVTKGSFIPRTPCWALEVATAVVMLYAVVQGIEGMGRAANVLLPLSWLAFLAVYLMAVQTAQQPWNLLPHVPALGWGSVVQGAWAGLWAFASTTAIPNLLAHLARRRSLNLVLLGGTGWVLVTRAMELAAALTVLGVEGILWYRWPTVTLLRVVHTQGFLVNRVGALLLLLLTTLVGSFYSVRLWNAWVCLHAVVRRQAARGSTLRPKEATAATRWTRWLGPAFLSLAVVAMAVWLNDPPRLHAFRLYAVGPGVAAFSLGLPVLLWLMDRARGTVRA